MKNKLENCRLVLKDATDLNFLEFESFKLQRKISQLPDIMLESDELYWYTPKLALKDTIWSVGHSVCGANLKSVIEGHKVVDLGGESVIFSTLQSNIKKCIDGLNNYLGKAVLVKLKKSGDYQLMVLSESVDSQCLC